MTQRAAPIDRTTRRLADEASSAHKRCLRLALDLVSPYWEHVCARELPRTVPGWSQCEVDAAPHADRPSDWPPPKHRRNTTDGTFHPDVRCESAWLLLLLVFATRSALAVSAPPR
jgi:hypothetical protein